MSKPERDALEELLRHSEPRPVPAPADLAAVKAAVRQDWQEVTGKRRTQRRVRGFALAATVLVGLFAAFNLVNTPDVDSVAVASIDRQFGSVFLLGEDGQLHDLGDASSVPGGHTLVTAGDAGIALAWGGGGSLRVGANTRIRFTSEESAYLERGRVYFDSVNGLAADSDSGAAPVFVLETPQGTVRHIGTQYMAETDVATLVISVREGTVIVDNTHHEQQVASGQQARLSGAQRPSVLSISRFGERWDWLGPTTPPLEVDGRSLHEFLVWVSRETGLEIRYAGGARSIARDEAILKGTVNSAPLDALRLRVATAALDWRIEEGVIHISD